MNQVEAMKQATKELSESMTVLSKSTYGPVISAWRKFTAAAHEEGALSRKHKELIAIAASIIKGCERCISYHVRAAIVAGATDDEIMEASLVAVIMDGGPAVAHLGLVLDAVAAHREGAPCD